MTPARRRVLQILGESPITPPGLVVYKIRRDVIRSLQEAGLVKFRPYGKPPSFAITAAGRAVLEKK